MKFLKKLLRMIFIGAKEVAAYFLGSKNGGDVYLGNIKVFPTNITYTIRKIYTATSDGGNWVKVTGANYAYVTVDLNELHNGVYYQTISGVSVKTFTSNQYFTVGTDGELYFDKNTYGTTELEQTWRSVSFQVYGINSTVDILLGSNTVVSTSESYRVSGTVSPTGAYVNAVGQKVYVTPNVFKVIRRTYTSGSSNASEQLDRTRSVYIYTKFTNGSWIEKVEDQLADGSAYEVAISRNNSGNQRSVYIGIADANYNPENIVGVKTYVQKAAAVAYSITLHLDGIEEEQVLSYDPEAMYEAGATFETYVDVTDANTQTCRVLENGVDRGFTYVYDASQTMYKLTITNIQGDIDLYLKEEQAVQPTIYSVTINAADNMEILSAPTSVEDGGTVVVKMNPYPEAICTVMVGGITLDTQEGYTLELHSDAVENYTILTIPNVFGDVYIELDGDIPAVEEISLRYEFIDCSDADFEMEMPSSCYSGDTLMFNYNPARLGRLAVEVWYDNGEEFDQSNITISDGVVNIENVMYDAMIVFDNS